MKHFTALFERTGGWWIASVAEIPGANTQGKTLKEARKNLKESLKMVLQANREIALKQAEGKNVTQEEIEEITVTL